MTTGPSGCFCAGHGCERRDRRCGRKLLTQSGGDSRSGARSFRSAN
jgi:hypothetical protein